MVTMNSLPIEILSMFFDYFPLNKRADLRLINRRFKEAIEHGLKRINYVYIGPNIPFCLSTKYVPFIISIRCTFMGKILPNFWQFLAKYCGRSIHIYIELELDINSLLPLGSNLKAIYCKDITIKGNRYNPKGNSSSEFLKLLNTTLTQLEDIRSIKNDHFCFTNLLVQERMKKVNDVIHLSFPCNSYECYNQIESFPVGLQSLYLNGKLGKMPMFTKQMANSLVELQVQNILLGQIKKLDYKFTSLRILSLILTRKDQKTHEVISILKNFNDAFSTVQSLYIHLKYLNDYAKQLDYFISSFTNLLKLEMNIDEVDNDLDGHFPFILNQIEPGLKVNLNVNSNMLKKLKVKAKHDLTLNVTSTKIENIEMVSYPRRKIDLKTDSPSLHTLKIRGGNFVKELASITQNLTQLKCLSIVNCELDSPSIANFFSNVLVKLTNLQKLKFDSPKPTGLKKISFNLENYPYLEYLSFDCPVTLNIANIIEQIEYIRCPVSNRLIFKKIDQKYCEVTMRRPTSLKLNFHRKMTNIKSVIIRYDYYESPREKIQIVTNLFDQLEKKCTQVSLVKFSLRSIHLLDKGYDKRIIEWVKSLKNLETFIAPISENDLNSISINFPDTQLELRMPTVDE